MSLAREEAEGAKTVTARISAEGYQGPDLRDGHVDVAGCVGGRSPHVRLISPGALTKWAIWNLEIKDACLLADGFSREVFGRAPCRWDSKDDRRVWILWAPV